jgi:predicted choloylglycine hydrolase
MPTTVALHQLDELAHGESKNEILLDTKLNTELHIIAKSDRTIITFPYGNKFDIVDGMIIIHEK